MKPPEQLFDQFLAQLASPPEEMYPYESDQAGRTIHSRHCQALFNRRDSRCHRCCELLMGAAPRKGWQREYFRRKLEQIQRRLPLQ